jgi:hypothetical protein
MENNKSFLGLFLAVLVLLPGCMHVPTYKSRPLQSVRDHCVHRDGENNVIVQAKVLSKEEQSTLFGDRSAFIHDNDIQVIHLAVHNSSNEKYSFSPADIDFSTISCRDVEKLMKTSSASSFGRGVISGVAGTGAIGWGITGPMLCQSMAIAYVFLPFGIVAAGLTFVFFGSSIKSMVMNKRISKDLKEKMLHKKIILNSGDHYDGLIFVTSSDYKPQFSISMHEKGNKKNSVTFGVDLRKNNA